MSVSQVLIGWSVLLLAVSSVARSCAHLGSIRLLQGSALTLARLSGARKLLYGTSKT